MATTTTEALHLLDRGSPPHAGESEPHYRRGYHQGAVYVLEALKSGATVEELHHLVENDLQDWRSSSTTPAFPP